MKTFSRIFIAITIAIVGFVIYITRDGDTYTPSGDGEVVWTQAPMRHFRYLTMQQLWLIPTIRVTLSKSSQA